MGKDNCPRFAQVQDAVKKSKAFTDAVKPVADKLYPKLKEITDLNPTTFSEASKICSYFYWADLHNLALKI